MLLRLSVTSKVLMMSKLLTMLLALTFATSVVAQQIEIARVKNNDGGYIVFMANYCGKNKDLYLVYGFGQNDTISGCFTYNDGTFHVLWNGDGEVKRYPGEKVTWHPDFINGMKKDRKTY